MTRRRRVLRFALNLVTALSLALSLVLCVAVAALWARSYHRRDAASFTWPRDAVSGIATSVQASSFRGRVNLALFRRSTLDLIIAGGHFYSKPLTGRERDWYEFYQQDANTWKAMGFVYRDDFRRYPVGPGNYYHYYHYRGLVVPYWAALLAAAALPAAWVVRAGRRRRRRRRPGLCPHCGYDLTGNTSGVCPECGTAAARR
jgi:hypothetical protein